MTDNFFENKFKDEIDLVKEILPYTKFRRAEQQLIIANSQKFIKKIRNNNSFSTEEFLHRFSLSEDEGVAILGLAEGLLRTPDFTVSSELARDKLSDKHWENFLFKRTKSFKTVFASFGLYISGKYSDVIKSKNIVSKFFERVGQRVFITILKSAILFLSKEFVFSDEMHLALDKCKKHSDYKFAFDLLGESARTLEQSTIYYKQYQDAVKLVSAAYPYNGEELSERPNLSVKLTALYPRFELAKIEDIEEHLFPKLLALVKEIKDKNLTITFDAEESYRLDVYLLFITKLLKHKSFKDFAGIGLVIQAYQIRSLECLNYVISLAKELNKKIPVRLVKGAYWDLEIKHAQEQCLKDYPVFTRKDYTDLNYNACAKKMLENDELIYAQFATHNAVTAATVIELAGDKPYEFQKLYGMGNALHAELIDHRNVRIYAPVGTTKDLLAYLIRRILENGASANFVSKVNSLDIPLKEIAYDVNDKVLSLLDSASKIALPENIYPNRKNGMGYELGYKTNYDYIQDKVSSYFDKVHKVGSIINGKESATIKNSKEGFCPARSAEKFSTISDSVEAEIKDAINYAQDGFAKWGKVEVAKRALIIEKVAQVFEDNKFELYALLIKEAGKSVHDAINEVIEAIDFCRYYASQAKLIMVERNLPGPTGETNILTMHPRGVFLCVSPWNFPFAIFAGQIVAALAAGNTVVAKPSGQTPVIANFAVKLMHKAGVPKSSLQLLITSGSNISKYAVTDERVAGVTFTGSCGAAQSINSTLSTRKSGIVPFIAETGGQNTMVVDSSALLEQVTDDVLTSAFYSAGQRCSALRMLYVQEEIYDDLLVMLKGATELIKVGDTSDFTMDIGPVIDQSAKDILDSHIEDMKKKGHDIYVHPHNGKANNGHYFYPHIITVKSINDIPDEKFGPILHIAKFKSKNLDKVIDEVNNCGFGLTFGVHSRIEEKIEYIRSRVRVGNFYANRSIVGAKVESQPFGGENKSGTGFKAGGPNYLLRFMTERVASINTTAFGGDVELLNS